MRQEEVLVRRSRSIRQDETLVRGSWSIREEETLVRESWSIRKALILVRIEKPVLGASELAGHLLETTMFIGATIIDCVLIVAQARLRADNYLGFPVRIVAK